MSKLIPITTPLLEFEGHEAPIDGVAVFPDKRRIVTSSHDKTLRLWDLKTGVVLKKMEGHRSEVLRPTHQNPLRLDLLAGFFSRWNSAGHKFSRQNDKAVEYQNLGATRRSNKV
jgi:WD40 repeat protein